MAIPRDDQGFAARFRAIEEQIRRLRSDIASQSTDPDDQIHDPLGNLIFGADLDAGSGILRPRLSATIVMPGLATTITATDWVEAFTLAGRRQNAAWEVRFNASCDSGTTGTVRAVIAGTDTELHAPANIADGDTLAAAWTLDLPGAWDDYLLIEIQGQRLTGAGSLRVRPYSVAGG